MRIGTLLIPNFRTIVMANVHKPWQQAVDLLTGMASALEVDHSLQGISVTSAQVMKTYPTVQCAGRKASTDSCTWQVQRAL